MTTPSTTAPQAASAIVAMHARYEASFIAYEALDEACSPLSDGDLLRLRLSDAMRENHAESDALRMALLYQVPVTWAEAMILQYHIHIASDLYINGVERDTAGGAALEVALETLLDFMACKIDQDHGEIGPAFQRAAVRVFYKRRRRLGDIEGDVA